MRIYARWKNMYQQTSARWKTTYLSTVNQEPKTGLSWVDYSDIEAEFEDLSNSGVWQSRGAHKSPAGRQRIGTERREFRPGETILKVYDPITSRHMAEVKRAEHAVYQYHPHKLTLSEISNYGGGLVRKGFADGVHSIVKSVDLLDPRVEVETFLKYTFVKADMIGGMCPVCKHKEAYTIEVLGSYGYNYRYKCKWCHFKFSPKSGGLFHGSKLDMTALWIATRLSLDTRGVSSVELAKRIGTSQKISWNLRRVIRENSLLWVAWDVHHSDGEKEPT